MNYDPLTDAEIIQTRMVRFGLGQRPMLMRKYAKQIIQSGRL